MSGLAFVSSPARLRIEQAARAHEAARREASRKAEREAEEAQAWLDAAVRELAAAARTDAVAAAILAAPRWKAIIMEVCAAHGMTVRDVKSGRRTRPFTRLRQEIAYRLVAETDLSLPKIGRRMGGFDHTTIIHGVRAHAWRHGLDLPRGMGWGSFK